MWAESGQACRLDPWPVGSSLSSAFGQHAGLRQTRQRVGQSIVAASGRRSGDRFAAVEMSSQGEKSFGSSLLTYTVHAQPCGELKAKNMLTKTKETQLMKST